MICNNCGAPLENDAKFCTNCGTAVAQTINQQAGHTAEQPNSERNNETRNTQAQDTNTQSHHTSDSSTTDTVKQTIAQIQEHEYVEKGKVYAINYLNYAKVALKSPFKTAKQMQHPDIQLHGITTIGLYSFLMPLLFFFMLQTFNSYMQVPFFDVVIKPFVILAIVSLVMVAVLFGVGRLMRVNVSFKSVLGAYGSLHTLPVALLVLSMILLIFNNYGLITLVLSFMFLVTTTINVSVLFALKSQLSEEIGLDVVYGIILSYIALIVLVLVVSDSIMGSMMMDMENILYDLLFMF